MNTKTLLGIVFLLAARLMAAATDPVYGPHDKCGFVSHQLDLKSRNPDYDQQMLRDEQLLQQVQQMMAVSRQPNTIFTLPVVVHVIYNTAQQNISDQQIQSQIDVLNEDFGRRNADTTQTPAAFRSVASATNFQFCLAKQDPNGNTTTGIERRQNTSVTGWTQNDNVKHYSSGGLDAWDVNQYLNIWVCNFTASSGLLGYGEFPSTPHTNTFGVVLQYDAFGRTGTAAYPYNKGRTCTHEFSHCFRLSHIWADDGGLCMTNGGGTDYVSDTPDQADANYGCPTFPLLDACTGTAPGVMFMNYMDYSDDRCLNMFTAGQASRMNAAIAAYYPTLKTSTRCQDLTGIVDAPNDFQFSIYPNPSNGIFNLDMFLMRNIGSKVILRVYNLLGEIVHEEHVENPNGNILPVDLSDQQTGVYFVNLSNDHFDKTVRVTLTR